jgi:hypothetical protein
MLKAIQRMARYCLLYLFSGKCPVPDTRGGWNFDNLPPDFDPASNDSTYVFAHIIHSLPIDDVIPFNIHDICDLASGPFEFCKNPTDSEADVVVFVLNHVGMLAKWMGAKLIFCNVGGDALNLVYSGIDQSLFEAIASKGVHMSICARHRPISLKKVQSANKRLCMPA